MADESKAYEVNFDGLIGPTHNYSGLSFGNIASTSHAKAISNPKEAALQGLKKMELMIGLGVKQSILLPHERPNIAFLKNIGFDGSNEAILQKAYNEAPHIFQAAFSAAPMWTANSATIAPSSDTFDRRLHLSAANLSSNLHRSIEYRTTEKLLQAIFQDPNRFTLHPSLPSGNYFSDEGAANHTRFCQSYNQKGLQLFVYGRSALNTNLSAPKQFPARQTLESVEALVRLHQLDPSYVVKAQQNPHAIDAGVFHNDVISVGNKNVFLYHEESFVDTEKVIEELKAKMQLHCHTELITIKVETTSLSLKEAVATYLFNSQLIEAPNGSMVLIAPMEAHRFAKTRELIDKIIQDKTNPIESVHYIDLKESMQNGGGPACLRLRVVMTNDELNKIDPKWILTDTSLTFLKDWVRRHYRDSLHTKDLLDPALLNESRAALDELSAYFQLGAFYSFQQELEKR